MFIYCLCSCLLSSPPTSSSRGDTFLHLLQLLSSYLVLPQDLLESLWIFSTEASPELHSPSRFERNFLLSVLQLCPPSAAGREPLDQGWAVPSGADPPHPSPKLNTRSFSEPTRVLLSFLAPASSVSVRKLRQHKGCKTTLAGLKKIPGADVGEAGIRSGSLCTGILLGILSHLSSGKILKKK